jgi:hypothetical protein
MFETACRPCCLTQIEPRIETLTEADCRLRSMVCNVFGHVEIRWLYKSQCCLTRCRGSVCRAENWCDHVTYQQTIGSRTFDSPALQIPTRSHKPTKYRPRFQPLCSPDTPWNPTTSERKLHFPFFTSIQWAVIPRNDAFVLSAVQPSAVDDTLPGAFYSFPR